MRTRMILLNGAPSASKTTLARAVHEAVDEPMFYLSLDEFRGGIRPQFWIGDQVAGLFRRIMRAYLEVLEAVAAQGLPVVSEAVITPDVTEFYAPLFERFDVTLVGVRCPLTVNQERESRRTDRRNGPIDLDVANFELVHQQDYDLEVDTSVEPTTTSLARILAASRV